MEQVGETSVCTFETRGGMVIVHGGLLYVWERGLSPSQDNVAKDRLIVADRVIGKHRE